MEDSHPPSSPCIKQEVDSGSDWEQSQTKARGKGKPKVPVANPRKRPASRDLAPRPAPASRSVDGSYTDADDTAPNHDVGTMSPATGNHASPGPTSKTGRRILNRKPRDPRPPLMKWNDDDWKMALLSIVWACGDECVRIPFEKAAQKIRPTCTASSLQQALLKLRERLVKEGKDVPPRLRMQWAPRTQGATPGNTPISVPLKPIITPVKQDDSAQEDMEWEDIPDDLAFMFQSFKSRSRCVDASTQTHIINLNYAKSSVGNNNVNGTGFAYSQGSLPMTPNMGRNMANNIEDNMENIMEGASLPPALLHFANITESSRNNHFSEMAEASPVSFQASPSIQSWQSSPGFAFSSQPVPEAFNGYLSNQSPFDMRLAQTIREDLSSDTGDRTGLRTPRNNFRNAALNLQDQSSQWTFPADPRFDPHVGVQRVGLNAGPQFPGNGASSSLNLPNHSQSMGSLVARSVPFMGFGSPERRHHRPARVGAPRRFQNPPATNQVPQASVNGQQHLGFEQNNGMSQNSPGTAQNRNRASATTSRAHQRLNEAINSNPVTPGGPQGFEQIGTETLGNPFEGPSSTEGMTPFLLTVLNKTDDNRH